MLMPCARAEISVPRTSSMPVPAAASAASVPARGRVVVGERDDVEPGGGRGHHHVAPGVSVPSDAGRVGVEVDAHGPTVLGSARVRR